MGYYRIYKGGKMKKKAKKVQPKVATLMDRLPANRGEWLLLCIKFTERCISNPPKKTEQMLVEQSDKLLNELAEWKKANKDVTLRNL
jgi:hypothetical protein